MSMYVLYMYLFVFVFVCLKQTATTTTNKRMFVNNKWKYKNARIEAKTKQKQKHEKNGKEKNIYIWEKQKKSNENKMQKEHINRICAILFFFYFHVGSSFRFLLSMEEAFALLFFIICWARRNATPDSGNPIEITRPPLPNEWQNGSKKRMAHEISSCHGVELVSTS